MNLFLQKKLFIGGLIFLVSCSTSKPKQMFLAKPKGTVVSKELTYRVGKQRLKGFLAMPEGRGPFPGVLIVHEWWGQTEYPRERARMLAQKGYAAFAVDMYGGGITVNHPREAKAFSGKVMNNLDEAQRNFNQALETLKKQKKVDSLNMAAIGYCFGGAIVLEMARRQTDLKIVASYHGDLTPLTVNKIPSKMKTRLLIFNGSKDPMVPRETVDQVHRNLREAKVNYRFVNYEGVKHGFTNKEATKLGKKFNLPLVYNEKADKNSWETTLKSFKLILR